jgi:plastocyanin
MNFEPVLAVRRLKERSEPPVGPGLFWILIVVFLFFMGTAVYVFDGDRTAENASGNGGSPTPTASQLSRIYTVNYKNGVFSPTNLRIHVGDTVRFRNDGIFPIRILPEGYPDNADLPGFASVGDIPQDSFFAYTFAVKGVFGYYNEKNSKEVGTIIVR